MKRFVLVLGLRIVQITIILYGIVPDALSQQNLLSHYFSSSAVYNPALAGDTRFARILFNTRIQPSPQNVIKNSLLSADFKIPNHRSGLNLSLNRITSVFDITSVKTSYSHAFALNSEIWIKGGLGLSVNSVNTHSLNYRFPDQYNNFGFTGQPTAEPQLNEKSVYTGLFSGMAVYAFQGWFTMAAEYLNFPQEMYAGQRNRVPFRVYMQAGYLFTIDKDKKAKRMFSRYGSIEPFSSLGPVLSFSTEGPFRYGNAGINGFFHPVFWGLTFRRSAWNGGLFSEGTSGIHILGGYRREEFSIAYSFDFRLNSIPSAYRTAHEISLIWYFYTIRDNYRKIKLSPFPNQLMY